MGTTKVEVRLPREFRLHQNYPNPFNPETTIKFDLPRSSHVRILIYNTLGQVVRELVNDERKAGYHKVLWNGRDNFGNQVSSGMYILRIVAGEYRTAKKMILIR